MSPPQESCLHVFLSGLRLAYREALLTAVGAPIGSSQAFEFSLGRNVSEETAAALAKLQPGNPVFLTFVDRYAAGGYRFTPMRPGAFLHARVDAQKVRVVVSFGAWPTPKVSTDFNRWTVDTLGPLGAPRLVSAPEDGNDGRYVLLGPDVPKDLFDGEQDGWRALVEKLSQAKVLQTSAEQTVIFARLDVLEVGENKAAEWDGISKLGATEQPTLRLSRNTGYRANVSYFFPLQGSNTQAEVPYELVPSSGLEPGLTMSGSASALSRSQEWDFRVVALTPRSRETLKLRFGPAPTDIKRLVAPKLEIPIATRASPSLFGWLLGIGLFWVVGAGLAGQAAHGDWSWGHYVGPAFQFVALIAMFRVFGFKLT